MSLLITNAQVEGRPGTDVRIRDGRIVEVGAGLIRAAGEETIQAHNGALLPGLHDHHVHLRALAAARASVPVGPPDVRNATGFAHALRGAAARAGPGAWCRATGYHERVAGVLDRTSIDAVVANNPVRIQHRTGALWILNSRAIVETGLDALEHDGVERDQSGRPNGRIWRLDSWLARVTPHPALDLGAVSLDAARAGVTGFTDATAGRDQPDFDGLAAANADGVILQRLCLMCPPGVGPKPAPDGDGEAGSDLRPVSAGPTKVVLDDDRLPALDDLTDLVETVHRLGRSIAIHCVTDIQLLLALTALTVAGPRAGDRLEHAGIVPAAVIADLRRLGVTVVTQPHFIAERGDEYLQDVDPSELPNLYRCASLIAGGVPTAAGTDAPFGRADPWAAMRAAVERHTPSGAVVGPEERVSAATALGLFLGRADSPGRRRRIVVGAAADLCLVREPLEHVLRALDASLVAVTIVAGAVIADQRGHLDGPGRPHAG